ncbi:MAG: lysophospholipid acyltransferase family protein [Nocardioidaceae bacterium]
MARQRLGWALTICVVIVRPLMLLLTKQDWRDTGKLPATGGCVLVANHISHADPLVYAHFVYDSGRLPRFLAKSEVVDLPIVGVILKSAGQIPVYRQSRNASQAFSAAAASVRRGECVIVYPEGTISRDPDLWPMVGKTGAARIALSTQAPLIPTAQWGAQQILPPYASRPRLFPRTTIQVQVGDPVDLDDLRDQPLTPAVLREATERIMTAITILLETIRDGHAPSTRFDPTTMQVPRIGNPDKPRPQQRQPRRGAR